MKALFELAPHSIVHGPLITTWLNSDNENSHSKSKRENFMNVPEVHE